MGLPDDVVYGAQSIGRERTHKLEAAEAAETQQQNTQNNIHLLHLLLVVPGTILLVQIRNSIDFRSLKVLQTLYTAVHLYSLRVYHF